MYRLISIMALLLVFGTGLAQTRNCLRMMTIEELTRTSTLIARVKVHRTDKARYRGMYNQLAVLHPVDVIEGDFTLKEINVLARSNVRCADDYYVRDKEMLVFLAPADSLFHTQNFQYGQFFIEGEMVRGWRDKTNKVVDKPYSEVRREVEAYVNALHNPPSDRAAPATPPKPIPTQL